MEVRIKAQVETPHEIEKMVAFVQRIEEEHDCKCTLLEIERVVPQPSHENTTINVKSVKLTGEQAKDMASKLYEVFQTKKSTLC